MSPVKSRVKPACIFTSGEFRHDKETLADIVVERDRGREEGKVRGREEEEGERKEDKVGGRGNGKEKRKKRGKGRRH